MELAYIQECLSYSPDTGALTWKTRPRHHFQTERAWKTYLSRDAGKVTGTRPGKGCRHGYGVVAITHMGKPKVFLAHRVAYALYHGAWPTMDVDHIDGNKLNNKINNLREVTHLRNMHNQCEGPRTYKGHNRELPRGVYKKGESFQASICVNYKQKCLGTFKTVEEAHAAYRQAVGQFHG